MLKFVHTSQTIMHSQLLFRHFADVNNLNDVRLTYGHSGLLKMLNSIVYYHTISLLMMCGHTCSGDVMNTLFLLFDVICSSMNSQTDSVCTTLK